MFHRASLAMAVLVVIGAQKMVDASPMTYDFTGNLTQPVAGTRTFSGSFTLDVNPTIPTGSPQFMEDGSDVSLTLNLGRQVIHYVNTVNDPDYVTFQASVVPVGLEKPPGSPAIDFGVSGGSNGGAFPFQMGFSRPGGIEQLTNLASLNWPLDTSHVYLSDSPGGPMGVEGVITSIEAVPAPEPNALVAFAVLGAAAWAYRRCRAS